MLGVMLATIGETPLMAQASSDWSVFGQNPANTGSTAVEAGISVTTAPQLKPVWTFTAGGDVSARAAVVAGVAYFPDWGGNIWAVNTATGKAVWSHQLSDYFSGAASGSIHARVTPAVSGGTVYVGTQEGAYLLAINASTGTLAWKTQLSVIPGTTTVDDPYAIISVSPVVSNGVVYTGVASVAEGATSYGVDIATSTARGSVVAVSTTGTILWKTYTVPMGYIGGGVWGSNLVVDASRGTVFAGTGDNYSHPASTAPSSISGVNYGNCLATANQTEATCLSPNDHVDSILALSTSTGSIKWASKQVTWNQQSTEGVANGSDDWNVDCLLAPYYGTAAYPQCPTNHGPDYDFGSAPNEITYQTSGGPQTIIGAGQKSGIYYALNPDTGNLLWETQVGPGSALGGMEWGSATDGNLIYVAISNYFAIPYTNSTLGSAGSWAALNPANGDVVWQTADPNGAIDLAPMAVANGVVYAASMAGTSTTQPTMFALNAASGKILWSYAAGSSVIAGATIVDGVAYWGSGYTHLGLPGQTPNNKFFAFSVAYGALHSSSCNGVYSGTYSGNLTITAGQSCTFTGGGVTGNVTLSGGTLALANKSFVDGNLTVSGGSLSLTNSTVNGNVTITTGGGFSLGPAVTVGGNLVIQDVPAGSGTNQVCGTTINGNVTVQDSGAAVLTGSSGCAGNTVGGNLVVQDNTAATTIDSNAVGGNLTDQSNTAATQVFTNTVRGNLQCSGNSSITGGGNTVSGRKQSQCSTF
jgi:polyvinyl alcohol dehydrogenase (cytochrome)